MFGGTVKLTPMGLGVLITSVCFVVLFYWRNSSKEEQSSELVNLKDLLILSFNLAELGGASVIKVHESAQLNEMSKGKTKEGANDPKTDADIFSHRLIVGGFKKYAPYVQVISEEHEVIAESYFPENDERWKAQINREINELADYSHVKVRASDVTVWVDPLDATQEFTEHLLQYVTIMICIAVQGRPTIGVIHKPLDKETVWGWDPYITSSNLKLGNEKSSSQQKIIVSRSHKGDVDKIVLEAFGNDTAVIPAGGAGYKTLQVIRGAADAYVHVTAIKKWDLCAPNAILNSVQGTMTTLDGKNIDYSPNSEVENKGGVVAAVKQHAKFLKLLRPLKPNGS